jgi:D-threo-aldose 1-dehydrogenase
VFDYSYDGIMRSFEDSLARLGVDRIDILYVHDVSPRWAGNEIEQRFETVMKGGYRALLALRESGTIHAFGVGINDAHWCERFAEAGDFDLFMLAGRYTLLDHSAHDRLLPLCRERGIGILLAAPFNSGILATGAQPGATFFYTEASAGLMARTKRIEAIAASHGVALPAAALQFPLRSDVVLAVVAGSRTPAEVTANIAHVTSDIPAAFWAELAHQGLMPPG